MKLLHNNTNFLSTILSFQPHLSDVAMITIFRGGEVVDIASAGGALERKVENGCVIVQNKPLLDVCGYSFNVICLPCSLIFKMFFWTLMTPLMCINVQKLSEHYRSESFWALTLNFAFATIFHVRATFFHRCATF